MLQGAYPSNISRDGRVLPKGRVVPGAHREAEEVEISPDSQAVHIG